MIKLEAPTSIFIIAPSNGGKTFFTKQLLEQADGTFKIAPSKIFYCYSVWQSLYDEMIRNISNIEFIKGLPSMETLEEWGKLDGHKILVLDDLMLDASDSSELAHLMCVGVHHYQMSCIYLLQNVFNKGKSMRSASLNCHYFILFRTYRDVLQIQTLGKQMFPGQIKYFMDAYYKATQSRFGYLVADLNPHSNKLYQLRTNILPNQFSTIYTPNHE